MSDNPARPRLRRPLLWCGLVVALLGIAFNLGLFFVPLDVWLRDPGLLPMPEVLIGWWALAVGLLMVLRSQLGRAR